MQPQRDDEIRGAKAIAFEMRCSVHTVYRKAADPRSPIYKRGTYWAKKSELHAWLKAKPEGADESLSA